jgi:hypothetical protein
VARRIVPGCPIKVRFFPVDGRLAGINPRRDVDGVAIGCRVHGFLDGGVICGDVKVRGLHREGCGQGQSGEGGGYCEIAFHGFVSVEGFTRFDHSGFQGNGAVIGPVTHACGKRTPNRTEEAKILEGVVGAMM